MPPCYELFDHTADMGIRVRAATLAELLQPAAQALYAVIGDVVTGKPAKPVGFDLAGDESASLLRDFLGELLVLFERDGRVVTELDVSVFNEDRLIAAGRTRLVDQERSDFHREVKAVTYHALAIRSTPDGYEATIIVDI